MAARNSRSHPRRTGRPERRTASWSHRPAVWLATLSTVVGVATGMFTLRDQVFPGEGSTAGAVNAGAYRAHVGRICDEINESEKLRRQGDRKLARQLDSARGITAQRDLLLDAARRSASRSSHTLSQFAGMRAPSDSAAAHRTTVAVWRRNLQRVLAYVERLDRASNRKGLMTAVDRLSRDRTALALDGQRVNEGLQRLGADNCDLQKPVVPKTINLPGAPKPRRTKSAPTKGSPRATPTPPPTASGSATSPSLDPRVNTPSTSPRVNTPSTSLPSLKAKPRVNTPAPDAPLSGGGEGG
jgi:hypothetical protein